MSQRGSEADCSDCSCPRLALADEEVGIFTHSVFLALGVTPILIAAVRSLGRRDAPRASEPAQL